MDTEEDPRSHFEDFHGFDDDSSPLRDRHHRGRSTSRSKSRDCYPYPSPSVASLVGTLDVVPHQQSHRLRRWMVEGLVKDMNKSLRKSFKLKF